MRKYTNLVMELRGRNLKSNAVGLTLFENVIRRDPKTAIGEFCENPTEEYKLSKILSLEIQDLLEKSGAGSTASNKNKYDIASDIIFSNINRCISVTKSVYRGYSFATQDKMHDTIMDILIDGISTNKHDGYIYLSAIPSVAVEFSMSTGQYGFVVKFDALQIKYEGVIYSQTGKLNTEPFSLRFEAEIRAYENIKPEAVKSICIIDRLRRQ